MEVFSFAWTSAPEKKLLFGIKYWQYPVSSTI